MRVVSFKVEDDFVRLLEELAKRKKTTKSEIIRRALRQYVMQEQYRPYITRRVRVW